MFMLTKYLCFPPAPLGSKFLHQKPGKKCHLFGFLYVVSNTPTFPRVCSYLFEILDSVQLYLYDTYSQWILSKRVNVMIPNEQAGGDCGEEIFETLRENGLEQGEPILLRVIPDSRIRNDYSSTTPYY